ncbi:MAG: AAA family ATPase [Proteobacteria bacterium]|nr:AAA family ATPase [Pseudomonadota bacterium]MBU1742772.1 AAA family ATPase [Pseudomonadota bacterium]
MAGLRVLLTGPPRSGKTTLIERIVRRLDRPVAGFFTREIREHGRRVGFSIITLTGQEGVLAHVYHQSRHKVGRYGVNLADLDRIAVPSVQPDDRAALVIVDEIGRMECLSEKFRLAVIDLLDSDHDVLGSIAQGGGPFIQGLKARADVELIAVTPANRDELVGLADGFD